MIETFHSARSLTVLFERNTSSDEESGRVRYSGYDIYWPDGSPVTLGLNRFCQFGARTLFGRKGVASSLLNLYLIPIESLESPLPKLPRGVRSRRFYIQRNGEEGRIMLLDGTPTDLVFDRRTDDSRVLHWVGLDRLQDEMKQWYDLVVLPVEPEEK